MKRSKTLLVLCAALAVLPAVGGGCKKVFREGAADVEEAWKEGEAFLRLCTTGQHDAAYDSAADSLKKVGTREALGKQCGLLTAKVGAYRATEKSHTWRVLAGSPRAVQIDRTLTFERGPQRMLLTLEQVGQGWKLRTFQTI